MKSMVITGVSSGIGRVTAEHFLNAGWRVFGSVRKAQDSASLESQYQGFTTLVMDVTNQESIDLAAAKVDEALQGGIVNLLVNNAGIAVYGPLMHVPIDKFEEQMNVNLTGVLRVTQSFLPLLGARDEYKGEAGRIIHIGSVSGRFTTPLLGPYCASKHALEALSDAMRRELSIYNIPVSIIQSAGVTSEIWNKAKVAESYTEGTAYARIEDQKQKIIEKEQATAMKTEKLSTLIWKIANTNRPRPRYLVTRNNLLFKLLFNAPDSWLDKFFSRTFMDGEEIKTIL